jgi:hypothetical protein
MRPGIGAVIAVLLGGAPLAAGAAEFSPVFVVPGKPGVPVVINGWDASYTVVEGDFGLDRPGQVNPVIVGDPLAAPLQPRYGAYYPRAGRRPGYGRLEVEPPPNRRLPPPAQSYHRSWQSGSQALPPTVDPPAQPADLSVNIGGDGDANGDRQMNGANRDMNRGKRKAHGNRDFRHRREFRRHHRHNRHHRRGYFP